MFEPATTHGAEHDSPNLGKLLEDALLQAKTLVQAELSLARSELKGELTAVYGSLLLIGISALFLQAALVAGSVLLVMSLGAGALAGAVVFAFALVGATFLLFARRALAAIKLPRTMARLTADATQILETAK
jgi:uncharacterized membrane protein YqjE